VLSEIYCCAVELLETSPVRRSEFMVRKVHCFIATQINESTKSISHVGNELASSYPRKYNTFNSLFGFYVKITGSEVFVNLGNVFYARKVFEKHYMKSYIKENN
jgi:hypothetical protein